MKNLFPNCMKPPCDLLPRESLCPADQILHVYLGELFFAFTPRNLFGANSAGPTVDSSHEIQKIDRNPPDWNKFKSPRLTALIILRHRTLATGTDATTVLSRFNIDSFEVQYRSQYMLNLHTLKISPQDTQST